ncbi:hypothetical protein SAMN05660461_0947 [Chitinophaga ginsengisegetis]|uniref:Uncharacterized protein n=1 Tax=Chitinophaga ginsengisegetis TaxID=393003 RepID=A0A1T5NAW6_9BACT|nr:hypothetical protein [Chitinophaga ginsengisegetis]SKC97562.1 hypothetical protein SAMN05660461_0947 [Chitinophaga ginsengisegetis]
MTNQPNKFDPQIITDRKEYISLFDNFEGNKQEVFKQILDIRKFEIELYWKRTTFFWTIIGSVIAGYFIVFSKTDSNQNSLKILFSLSNLGLVFSVGWYFANRGAKFWQVNWEKHVDIMEDDIIGPLYKTTINKEYYRKKFFHLLSPFPFSVSKINQVLNVVLIGFWVIIIMDLFMSNLTIELSSIESYYSFYSLLGLATFISLFSLFAFTQTGINNLFKKEKQLKSTEINFEKRGLKQTPKTNE